LRSQLRTSEPKKSMLILKTLKKVGKELELELELEINLCHLRSDSPHLVFSPTLSLLNSEFRIPNTEEPQDYQLTNSFLSLITYCFNFSKFISFFNLI